MSKLNLKRVLIDLEIDPTESNIQYILEYIKDCMYEELHEILDNREEG